MALIGSESKRRKLKRTACKRGLSGSKLRLNLKVSGVGVLTGLPGGVLGLGLEVLDITYLMAACGRACYGVGYIIRGDVDYNRDMALILAIWAGVAESTAAIAAGKLTYKIAGKAAIPIGAQVGAKLMSKVIPRVVGKIAAKGASKISTKWIPVVGGIVSAGINCWVADGLMTAAEKYYRNDYITLNEDLASAVEDVYDSHEPLWDAE